MEKIKFSHKSTKVGKEINYPEVELTFDKFPIVEGEFESFRKFLNEVLQDKTPSE